MENYNVPTLPAENFENYIATISAFTEEFQHELSLFRGQPCDEPLLPNLGRLEVDDIREYEKNIFEDFRKRYLAYCPKKYDNDFDLLALAQHFGLPTRLLDWTESALTALWFATEKDIEEENAVVWIFLPDQEDLLDNRLQDPFPITQTKVFCHNHISKRITAQSGWFTCHAMGATGNFIHMERLPKYRNKFTKILIPSKAFSQMRIKLNTMGINSATVYPDLNGLARHLKWKHLKADRFEPENL